MNPYIKNKLRSCKISNLQDIFFKFALQEDQKQKTSALDFETKPDTIQGSMKLQSLESTAQTAQTCQIVRNKSILKTWQHKKLVSPSQNSSNLPVTLRGPEHCLTENRQHASQTVADKNFDNLVLDNPVDKTVNNTANDDTKIVHLNRKSVDECPLMVLIGNRHHKALWDSGAGKCVISFDCYQSIPTKYKTILYPSSIKIKAANGILLPTRDSVNWHL